MLPGPLLRAVKHVFAQGIADCMLVGGSALAGYYAGHRRSDDLDLFVRDTAAHHAARLAVEALEDLGGKLRNRQSTAQFYDATCDLEGYSFTAQVVLDAHLFEVGRALRASDGVDVADLETLLKQKVATLVSRCSEKDLYDLTWLFRAFPTLKLRQLLAMGAEIDGGVSAEAVLVSLTGATLRQSACGFSRTQDASAVYQEISSLKESLAHQLDKIAREQPTGPVEELIRALKPRSATSKSPRRRNPRRGRDLP